MKLPLNTVSRNPGGVMFGGYQAALADPIAALACSRIFPGYSCWTRAIIGEQTLRRAVPPRRDVLGVGLLRVDAAARAEVGELELVVRDQDVLRLDVAVEDAVAVHVVHALEQLVHVILDALLLQVLPPPADELVDVHVHQLEDERETALRVGGGEVLKEPLTRLGLQALFFKGAKQIAYLKYRRAFRG